MDRITIAHRFRGPPGSGNGGYSCGVVAAFVDGPAEVTLRLPPPLDRPLDVERTAGGGVRVLDGGQLVAEARPKAVTLAPPSPPPSFAEATAASAHYPWHETHPYPGCFVCGSRRTPGDGLRVWPGAALGRAVAAAPFVPDDSLAGDDGRVRPEIVWSVLDCPSWFGYACFHENQDLVLLGRLAARIDGRPRAGEECVCTGWFVGREGRKIHCGSALFGAGGALLAVGQATWVTVGKL